MRAAILSGFLLVLFASCSAKPPDSFDKICDIFVDLQEVGENLPPEQRSERALKRIRERFEEDNPARVLWESVTSAQKKERYSIYKYAAEDTLGEPWECPAMKQFIIDSNG